MAMLNFSSSSKEKITPFFLDYFIFVFGIIHSSSIYNGSLSLLQCGFCGPRNAKPENKNYTMPQNFALAKKETLCRNSRRPVPTLRDPI